MTRNTDLSIINRPNIKELNFRVIVLIKTLKKRVETKCSSEYNKNVKKNCKI